MKYYTEYTDEKRKYLLRYGKGENKNWVGYNDCPNKCGEPKHKRKWIFWDTESMECFWRGTKIVIFIIPKSEKHKSTNILDKFSFNPKEYRNPWRYTDIKTFVNMGGYTYKKSIEKEI